MIKDIHAIESVQKFEFRMDTHEPLSLTELPTLERRRPELKLGQLFKIVHKLCFFPEDFVKLREQTPLLSNTHSLHPLYLHQPRAHTNSYFCSFVPHTCSFWNSLPFDNIVNASSLNSMFLNITYENIILIIIINVVL